MSTIKAAVTGIKLASGSPATYALVTGQVNATLTVTRDAEDVTTKPNFPASTLFPEGSLKVYEVSGEFVLDDSGLEAFETAANANTPTIAAQFDTALNTYTGTWVLASYAVTGGVAGAARCNMTLRGTGAITVA